MIEAEDGSSFLCHQKLAEGHALRRGTQVDERLWEELTQQSSQDLAYLQCLKLLARREYTSNELQVALAKRGYLPHSIQCTVSRLRDEGAISHDRYSEIWLRSRIRKQPESLKRLELRLVSKGLSSQEAASAIKRLIEEEPDIEIELCRAAAAQLRKRHGEGDILTKKLLSRGFSVRTIGRI